MPVDPANDTVEVYGAMDNTWRWRRVDDGNGRIVSQSSEGYTSVEYAREAAAAYNTGCPVVMVKS